RHGAFGLQLRRRHARDKEAGHSEKQRMHCTRLSVRNGPANKAPIRANVTGSPGHFLGTTAERCRPCRCSGPIRAFSPYPKLQGDTIMLARKFDPTSMAGLSVEARKAVNAAFDAISNWRTETVNNSEKNVAQVIEKMAAAARALGWPEQIVEATQDQMQS